MPERGLKIGEAAGLLGVATHVLRFWETQFPILRPEHTRSRHRFYHEKDVEALRLIKRLLHEEGFTITGANKYIREFGLDGSHLGTVAARARRERSGDSVSTRALGMDSGMRRVLSEVRRDLRELRRILQG
ncbi:MAG: MerR family transcriptional regulator [Candidatus Binataceae bacterium]